MGISTEIAMHDVIRLMDLKPVENHQAGYDAVGTGARAGKRIQIKGRSVSDEAKSNQRIGQIKVDQEWDSVMLVLMNDQYEPLEIYEAEREQILQAVANTSTKRRNRGALSVAKFKHLGRLVWSADSQKPTKF